ncbi:MAG: FG-GAP repeat protein, partial [Candidatus Marinimicrobia bacterium]|nr:FG-GAP repeat protein [Candidatus Neomarinimicrobiota bacterium]
MKTYKDEVRKRYFWKLLSAINAIISSTKYLLLAGLCLLFIACAGSNTTFVPYSPDSTINALPNQNPAYSKDKQSLSIDELKQTEWWTTVQKNIREKEYHITHQKKTNLHGGKPAYRAANRAQNLRTYFSANGVNILPRTEANPSWQTSISLENMGRGKQVVKVPKIASSRIDGSRIEFQRGSICEWYENSPKGIEQGFTVLEKPNGTGPLVLGLLTTGTTKPVLSKEEDSVAFLTASNREVLTYSDLHVFDTNGQSLLSRFEVNDQFLNIVIDDSSAIYPITVDPLFTSPVWTWESDEEDDYLGGSVSTAGDVNNDGYSDVIVGASLHGVGGSAFVFHGSENGLSTSPDWEAGTDVDFANFGNSVATAGDVNGDGYSDVIIGAYNYADDGLSWEGAAFVYYGSSGGLSLTPDWSGESNETGAYFGWSVGTAGDVNGDGYSDIIIGAPGSEYHTTGNAYVFHGSASGLGGSGTPGNADWSAEGVQTIAAAFGNSVATAGDVNGDGYSDIIIGAPYYDVETNDNEGKAFVYHGSASGLGALGTPSNADWNHDAYGYDGSHYGDFAGTAGDVNGDGYSDIVVGAPDFDFTYNNEGLVFIYLGSETGLNTTFHRYYSGGYEGAFLGSIATAGDINGDGFADIVVGSNPSEYGNVYVFKGSGDGLAATGVASTMASWSVATLVQNSTFGGSVGTAGDIDGDGLCDIIVGDGRNETVFVYFGSFPGIESTPSQTIDGGEAIRYFGRAMNTAGDIDADGYMDVIVGDRGYDGNFSSEGIAYIYYGSTDGVNTTTPDWEVTGGEHGAWLGWAVNSAGDVNGDGYGDIIIGAPGYGDYGAAFVYYGSASGIAGPPDIVVGDENQGEVCFGEVVAPAGDVNGDGYDDVIVSAPIYNVTSGGREGAAFLYLGSSQGLVETPAWDVFGEGGNYYGSAIGSAGDVNGDGYSDFFVYGTRNTTTGIFVYYGAPQGPSEIASWTVEDTAYLANTAGDVNDDGFSDLVIGDSTYSDNTGRVAIFHGSSSGLNLNGSRPVGNFSNADWSITGSVEDSNFGASVSTAGDANRDGYSDIIVGEPYSYSTASSGKAYIYYGSAAGITSVDPWSYECIHDDNEAAFGQSVISAGDINGDGFSDILIGAERYTDTFSWEGRIFFFYGNDGGGSSTPLPTQFETDGVTEIDKMGTSDSETAFVFSVRGRTPFGRGDVRVEWEAKLAGQPFDGTGTFTSTGWQDSG